jgi:secretion/DNA translocation related TadE-like protein
VSGTVVGLALVAATLALTGSTLSVCAGVVAEAAAAGAADAAALAAADSASGRMPGSPCAAAARLASANGAELADCVVDGGTVTVRVARGQASATATAGPPW